MALTTIFRKYPWLSPSSLIARLASLRSKYSRHQGLGRCLADFNRKIESLCDRCDAPLFSSIGGNTLSHYKHCRACNVLVSCESMPDYGNQVLYAPTNAFIEENIEHYRRIFSARPRLLAELGEIDVDAVIDLAGGVGIFPRIIAKSMPSVQNIQIVEVGEYASAPSLHQTLSVQLQTDTPVSFVHQNVFDFLLDSRNVCPPKALISFVHFIDHLCDPDSFLNALCYFAKDKEVYVLVYCHALDSYKGNDWFVINTATQGEHQIIYSQSSLQTLLSRYGTLIHSDVYFDDQYLLLKLNCAKSPKAQNARS